MGRFLAVCGTLVAVAGLVAAFPLSAAAEESEAEYTDTPLFTDDPLEGAKAGVDSHPWSDPLDGIQDYVTRGELAVRLAGLLGLDDSTASYFTDVRGQEDCFGAVGALYEAKLLTGAAGSSEFRPDVPVSRQQAFVWTVDALGYKLSRDMGSTVPFRFSYYDSTSIWLGGFEDRGMVKDELARGVANAYRLGIVGDSSDDNLYPGFPMKEDDVEDLLDKAFSQSIQVKADPPERVPAKVAYATQKLKSQGPLVMYLEYQLAALKYRPGLIDGIFDIRTRDAVLAFQKMEGLKKDGIVGAGFWERLATAQTPEPWIEEPGRRVEIDLAKQVLFMIEDNQVRKIVHCSSGASKTQTLTGYFQIEHKMERWTICSYRTAMYYSSFFDLEHKLAIHGYAQVPTWPASHGCVRVPMWNAKELFEEMPMGTRVYVYKS